MDEPLFLVYNESFNDILGAHADLKVALEWDLPFAYQAGIYDSNSDAVYATSNQVDPSRGTDKAVVISKLGRSLHGQWTRLQVPSNIKMPCGGVAYTDGVLGGILYCAQGDLQSLGGLVHMESKYPFRTREVLNNYHGRRFNSPKDAAIHSDGSVWFTDPIYGYDQGIRPAPELPNQV
jgi:gluconolactonase